MGIATGALVAGGIAAAGAVGGSLINADAAGRAGNLTDLRLREEADRVRRDMAAAGERGSQDIERFGREGMDFNDRLTREGVGALQQGSQQAQGTLQPFQQSQLAGLAQLTGLADPNSALYSQQRERLTSNVQRQLAAQGLLRSGNQVRGLGDIELGLEQQRVGVLQGLTNLGAAQQISNLQMGTGQGVGGLLANMGQFGAGQLAGIGQGRASAHMAGAQGSQIGAQLGAQAAGAQAAGITGGAGAIAGGLGALSNIAQGIFQGQENRNFQQGQLDLLRQYYSSQNPGFAGGASPAGGTRFSGMTNLGMAPFGSLA